MEPFDDLRVVDLSDRLSGAFAARLFGDYGADVILAEPPHGHALRHEPPFAVPGNDLGPRHSPLHAYVNWNKRSTVCSDSSELARLVADADLVVTTADPIAGTPLADVLAALPRDAVHLSVTPHGLVHPLVGRPGNNLTASARTGWSFINGLEDEPPLQMPRHQAGYVGGVTGCIAAAAALRRRDHSDVAEQVDVSELEAFALTVHPWGVDDIYRGEGCCHGPAGIRPRGEPGPLWDLTDGRMHFGVADFHNWCAAMEVLHLPDFGAREDLIPDIGRHSFDLADVSAAMAGTLAPMDRWPVFHALSELRCLVGVVQDIDDIVKDKQLAARDFLIETEVDGKRVRAVGPPAKLSSSPWRLARRAPRLDEHTQEIKVKTWRSIRTPREPQAIPPSARELSEGPLSGLRVLSFGQAWSGTFGTELLALLGAEVVQVGALHRVDVWRRLNDQVPKALADPNRVQHPENTQGLYNSVNLNKREITLDLRQEAGRRILWQLMPRFDILTDNFRPTVMPSWGITLEKLHEIRPGMIWASISGYGDDGPYSTYPANGATTEPMAGLASLHGYEGDEGMNTSGYYPDPVSGYFFVAALLAALRHRDRTGEPQRVDLSMMEAVTTLCGDAVVEYDCTGQLPRPHGNHHPGVSPHNYYTAAGGEWLAIAAETEAAWQALIAHIGDSRLTESRFETLASRKTHEAELDAIIGEWCASQDAAESEAKLGALGIAAARVVPLYELYSRPDEHFLESGFVTEVDHPEAGPTWLPGRPWRFSAAPATPVRAAPCVGQHSREILAAELGLSDSEYASLVDAGVTGTLDDIGSD
jgi:crotonobetainyl-CoA:carnitine CoA-transferase CaiB-like acyl-CoA transferase